MVDERLFVVDERDADFGQLTRIEASSSVEQNANPAVKVFTNTAAFVASSSSRTSLLTPPLDFFLQQIAGAR